MAVFVGGIATAFRQMDEAVAFACRSFRTFGHTLDRLQEAEYRLRFGHAPPGSWRTRRLAKKRRKAMDEALGDWEVPS